MNHWFNSYRECIDTVEHLSYIVFMAKTETPIEVELDSRQRLPLAKVIQGSQTRFRVDVQPGGELLLTPVVSISERELAMLKNPERMADLNEGTDQALHGKVVRFGPGHFTKVATEQPEEER